MAEGKQKRASSDEPTEEQKRERSVPTALKEKADRVVRIFKGAASDEEREFLFDQLADLACFNCGHVFVDDDDADDHDDECPAVEDDGEEDDDEEDSEPPPPATSGGETETETG